MNARAANNELTGTTGRRDTGAVAVANCAKNMNYTHDTRYHSTMSVKFHRANLFSTFAVHPSV